MTRLVIHIGDSKAGSTAIQSMMQTGAYRLSDDRKLDLLYAVSGRRGAQSHHRLANALFMKRALMWRDRDWGALAKELRDRQPDIAILSSERFEQADPKVLRETLDKHFQTDPLDLHLVCYLRPHVDRIRSLYASAVTEGRFRGDLPNYVEELAGRGDFVYSHRLSQWRSQFGDAQFTVRPVVEDKLPGGCVATDFLGVALTPFGARGGVEGPAVRNASLSGPALEVVRKLWMNCADGAPRKGDKRPAIVSQFAKRLVSRDPFAGRPLTMPQPVAQRIAELFRKDAEACDKTYLGGPVLSAQLDLSVEAAAEARPDPLAGEDAHLLSAAWLDFASRMPSAGKKSSPQSAAAVRLAASVPRQSRAN